MGGRLPEGSYEECEMEIVLDYTSERASAVGILWDIATS